MKYKARSVIWELTMACNMRCKHCGSICKEKINDELSTQEALDLCDQLGKMGPSLVSLSGGEPSCRKDWHLIAERLYKNDITVTMITNGWQINQDFIDKVKQAKINCITISIDGLKEHHDHMRREGSYNRSIEAFKLLVKNGIPTNVCTTINNHNINELEDMKAAFIDAGVKMWQLQLGLPMGSFLEQEELTTKPKDVDRIIDFVYENIDNPQILIQLTDCIGYFSEKSIEIRKRRNGTQCLWKGCNAGKSSFGILHNGDICGCASIRDPKYIAGNIKNQTLKDIWENSKGFDWNRKLQKEQLNGFCSICNFGDDCLGGCANSRLCFEKDIYGENRYCSYANDYAKKRKTISNLSDINEIALYAKKCIAEKKFQLAELFISRGIEIDPKPEIKQLYANVLFELGAHRSQ